MRILLLPAFFLCASIAWSQPLRPVDSNAVPVAGIVNGDTIWLDVFSRDVGRRLELQSMGNQQEQADVVEAAWNDVVTRTLLMQEANRRSVGVTQQQVDSVLLKATPEFVKRGVVDSKGQFDIATLRSMLYSPDSLVRARLGTDATPTDLQTQTASLRESMQELRERLSDVILEERLRAVLNSTFVADSAALRKEFERAVVRCTVEVAILPCARAAEPEETELKRYYDLHTFDFKTDTPLRRIAYLSWSMAASKKDSTTILTNIQRFVSDINARTNKKQRDSLWNAVASLTVSGDALLHPDSAATRELYAGMKGAALGRARGPITNTEGVHVFFVDSIISLGKNRVAYKVRGIATSIEPTQATVDSVLLDVQRAIDMYENGTELGAVAQRYGKRIGISPFFSRDQKLFGSYRIADVAFNTQKTAATDPVDTPEKGVVLGVVVDSVDVGIIPFDAAFDVVRKVVRRDRACMDAKVDARKFFGMITRLPEGQMFIADAPKDMKLLRNVSVEADGMIGDELFDPTATREILLHKEPGLFGPFLGDAGWFVVNTLQYVVADPKEFQMYLDLRGSDLMQMQRDVAYDNWLALTKRNAIIVDNRWIYFRY